MEKERLSLSCVKEDLAVVLKERLHLAAEKRLAYFLPVLPIALVLGLFFKSLWVGALLLGTAAYHGLRFALEYKGYLSKKKALLEARERKAFSITVQRFDHIGYEQVFEPHAVGLKARLTKTVLYFYFASGSRWRVPSPYAHYAWSADCSLSTQGLINTALQGDEFYFLSLQGTSDLAYAYPCKYFLWEEKS